MHETLLLLLSGLEQRRPDGGLLVLNVPGHDLKTCCQVPRRIMEDRQVLRVLDRGIVNGVPCGLSLGKPAQTAGKHIEERLATPLSCQQA